MSDIVERLRYPKPSDSPFKLQFEAADEIERLTAATVRMTEEINHLRQERERLRIELKAAQAGLGGLQETVLRTALKRYGLHTWDCRWNETQGEEPCDCGWDKTLADVSK